MPRLGFMFGLAGLALEFLAIVAADFRFGDGKTFFQRQLDAQWPGIVGWLAPSLIAVAAGCASSRPRRVVLFSGAIPAPLLFGIGEYQRQYPNELAGGISAIAALSFGLAAALGTTSPPIGVRRRVARIAAGLVIGAVVSAIFAFAVFLIVLGSI